MSLKFYMPDLQDLLVNLKNVKIQHACCDRTPNTLVLNNIKTTFTKLEVFIARHFSEMS